MREPTPRVAELRRASTIRARARELFELCRAGELADWSFDASRLEAVADGVVALVRERFPDGRVPIHGRYRHFDVGGVDRLAAVPAGADRLDLVVVSVLLDAGAGMAWRYLEASSSLTFARSEGLAVASLRMFEAGAFGDGGARRVDGRGLRALTEAGLAEGFQVTADNPLAGVAGRLDVMHRLGAILGDRRASDLFAPVAGKKEARLHEVLDVVLAELSPMFPGRLSLDGHEMGDVWAHPQVSGDGLVPFHKLSQWLTYSLVEPIAELGCTLTHHDELTGLAEYRNGGLFVDAGVLSPRDARVLEVPQPVASPLVVGWRALTLALLDELHPMVAARLGKTRDTLPLANMLEGGTWLLGRRMAESRRPPLGDPPLRIQSDGTVF